MSIGIDTCSAELSCTSPQPEQYTVCCLSSQPITGALLLLGFTDNTRHADLFQPDTAAIWPLEIPSSCPIKEHVSLIFNQNSTGC
jgi:hypothetical protein